MVNIALAAEYVRHAEELFWTWHKRQPGYSTGDAVVQPHRGSHHDGREKLIGVPEAFLPELQRAGIPYEITRT